MVSSASASRARNSMTSESGFRGVAVIILVFMGMGWARLQVQAEKDAFSVGHIADETPQGKGKTFDERRRGDNLIAPGQSGMLVNVDDFQCIAPLEMLFANLFDIEDGAGGASGRSGDIEAQ